ncbi:MAG: hypothetical protein IKU83_01930 [Lachnospiraceae bacterium]|nr:hypothetical protein [Lachnospiraceae bacterium]
MNTPDETKTTETITEPTSPFPLSETWAEDAQDDLEEWIELQGIQLRF